MGNEAKIRAGRRVKGQTRTWVVRSCSLPCVSMPCCHEPLSLCKSPTLEMSSKRRLFFQHQGLEQEE